MDAKKFLAHSIYGVLLLLLIISVVFHSMLRAVYSDNTFKIESDAEVLIAGASHAATGLNDYDDLVFSVARSGEPLYFLPYKLKKILSNNSQIQTVIVAVSPIHIAEYISRYYFNGSAGSRQFSLEYFPLIDASYSDNFPKLTIDYWIAYLKVNLGVPFNYMSDAKTILKLLVSGISYSDLSISGGYEYVEGSNLSEESLSRKILYMFGSNDSDMDVSELGVSTIEMIQDAVVSENRKLVFVVMPMHPSLRKKIPDKIAKEFHVFLNRLANMSNTEYVDYIEYPLTDDQYYDEDHINANGSEIITAEVLKTILESE